MAGTLRSLPAQRTPPISPRGQGSSEHQSPPNAAEGERQIARKGWSSFRTRGPCAEYGCFNCGKPDHWKRECPEPPSQEFLAHQKRMRATNGKEKLPTPDPAVSKGAKARAGRRDQGCKVAKVRPVCRSVTTDETAILRPRTSGPERRPSLAGDLPLGLRGIGRGLAFTASLASG